MAQLKSHNGYYLWDYIPSLPAALIFTVLFGICTLYVSWRAIKTRTAFSIAFIIGGIFETVGYVGRILARDHTDELAPYIMQSCLLLVAPALFAASVYMTLGRLMRSVHGERHSLIRVKWLTRLFVAGDVFSFLVQCSGAGLMVKQDMDKSMAKNIILAGLFIQIIMFGLFWATAVVFHVRMRRSPSAASLQSSSTTPWQQTLGMLYGVCALIMVRSIFRVVEYAMGHDGYPLTHEWTLYVFDAVLMFLTMALFGWWYPGVLQPPPREEWDTVESRCGTNDSDGHLMQPVHDSSRKMFA